MSANHPSAPFSRSISCGYRPDRQHRRDSPRLLSGEIAGWVVCGLSVYVLGFGKAAVLTGVNGQLAKLHFQCARMSKPSLLEKVQNGTRLASAASDHLALK